jgi:hypothetical protein
LAKFAELIVKECVTVLEQHHPYTIDPEAYHYAISLIEEHFGVEVIKKEWVGLTDEEVKDIVWNLPYEPSQEHIRAIEAKLKKKNNG